VTQLRAKTAERQAVRPANRIPANKLRVNMSNALTNAAQGLLLSEKRVLMFAVAKLDTFKPDGGTASGKVKLSASEYAEHYGVDPDTAYDQLAGCAETIIKKQVCWYEETPKGPKKIQINWLGKAEYIKGEGVVNLWFTPQIQPHLVQLKRDFTAYQLQQASALRSIYSWRLLELLSQFESTGWRQMSVEEFADTMDASEKQRQNFNNIKRRIIEPAVKELREKDGWLIEWTPIKEGRKVAQLRFEFKRNPQGSLF
jgi:plasmid replication initiation protein